MMILFCLFEKMRGENHVDQGLAAAGTLSYNMIHIIYSSSVLCRTDKANKNDTSSCVIPLPYEIKMDGQINLTPKCKQIWKKSLNPWTQWICMFGKLKLQTSNLHIAPYIKSFPNTNKYMKKIEKRHLCIPLPP